MQDHNSIARNMGKIAKVLKEIFLESDNLSVFMNSVSFGRVTSNGQFIRSGKLKFVNLGPDAEAGRTYETVYEDSFGCTIRIADFSPRDLNQRSIFTSTSEENRSYFKNIFNTYWKANTEKIGINICRNVAIKGYMLNFVDVKEMIHKEWNLVRENSTNCRRYGYNTDESIVNEFYFVGPKNCLLAISSINSLLYIRTQTLNKLIESNDISVVKRCLKNLLTCFYQVHKNFSELNLKTFKDEVAEFAEESALNRMVNTDYFDRRYYRTFGEKEMNPKEFLERLHSFVKDTIENTVSGSVFGIKDMYSYSNLINKVMEMKKEFIKGIFTRGFTEGMRIGLRIEMIGWRPCEMQFAEIVGANKWWEKEVNLVPDSFIYRNEKYSIPEKHRKFKINKLYINQTGKLMCDGNHPNVSGHNVCMGDLKIDLSDKLSSIEDSLKAAEQLLDMINFDSAYHNEDRDKLLEVSTKCDIMSEKTVQHKKDGIRELGTNFDDSDSEDEEEIIDEKKEKKKSVITKVKDNNGKVIAEIVKDSLTADQVIRIHNTNNDDTRKNIKSLETSFVSNNLPPVYVTQDVSVAQDISYVQQNGERRPVIFISGQGNNAQISTTETELSLGDADITRE